MPCNEKLVKGKIDEDRKRFAKLYIKAQRHTLSAEVQTAARAEDKRMEIKTKFEVDKRKMQEEAKQVG